MLYEVVENQDLLKKKETSGTLSNLGIKAPINKILLLGDILF